MNIQPGDLLLTRNKSSVFGKLIRFRALLGGQLEVWNHVAIMHHVDAAGTPWAIAGRPGGVGWVDARKYLRDPVTLTNVGQAKTVEQRQLVADGAVALLGVEYDWAAIGLDAVPAARLNFLWRHNGGDGAPAHVVCSSLADWLYTRAKLDNPSKMPWQLTTPADFADLIVQHGWQHAEGT